ncbi:MAG: helix-turn-helix domain-containing protein [Proteobacteria bacterium]|nr:helix-turn-helix domain-containing protein [Pseudomonadota bacterium]
MPDTFEGKVYLTTKEAATYLRRGVGTLEEWRRLKTGPPYSKFGTSRKACVLYARADLDAWVTAHRRETGGG